VVRQALQWEIGGIPGRIRHFISISKLTEEILRPYLPREAVIHALSNPVSYTLPGKPRADVSQKILLFAGRLSQEKGPQLACEAARIAGARLVVIGDGPMKASLEQAYPDVEFRGWATPAGIFEQMLRSTALIFPSVWNETQGIVVIEALSVGLPVIVSDVTAARDYIDGSNGLIFRSGDSSDLAEKMKVLLDNGAGTDNMSRYAHKKYWEKPFSFDKFLSDLLSIYRELLEKNDTHKLTNT
jgi:glycosyltransferase involved in cell wall biosynthesis